MNDKPTRRQSRVPVSRLGRMLRIGLMAGELTAGGIGEGIKRLTGISPSQAASVFLSTGNAERLARRLAGLRGAAMKLGQLLSMESAEILPPEFADALAILRSSADTMPVTQVRRILGREYGKGWEARFEEFDFEPIGAASIGQVHHAVANDGRHLALKIQYPGVARSINSDVDNLAVFLRLAKVLPVQFDISAIVKEAKRQLRQEADYLAEADYLTRYRNLVSDEPRIVVPRVYPDLTTKRILAMDYMTGEPLENLGTPGIPQALRDEIGELLEQLMFRELFEFHTMQTDPNFANYLYQRDSGKVVLLDFGATVDFSEAFTTRYARISRAIIEDDEQTLRAMAVAIGYLGETDSEAHTRQVMDVIRLVCEPLRHEEDYDFGASDLMSRARDAGLDLVFRSGEFRAPPPQTAFLHRKLVGSFLLCARIGARVNMQALILPFLRANLKSDD